MVNLHDEKQRYFYLGKCVSGKSINFYSEKLYPPIIDDIFEMGEDAYRELLMPFVTSLEFFDNIPSDMTIYEAIMLDRGLCILLIQSLAYFLKLNIENDESKMDINIYNIKDKKTGRSRSQLIIKNRLILDDDKFNDLKTLMLLMCNVREIKKLDLEKKPISKSKEKLLKARKENGVGDIEEKRAKLVNVYNYVVHRPPMPDYDKYLKWSIYQLYNTYENMIHKENIKFTYDVITNGMGTKEMKIESLEDKIIK